MATYNGEKYLRRQIDSILAQKVDCPFRILASDDGSTDGTLSILKSYKDKITLVSLPHERDATGNFLSLLKCAKAPFVALCDQDDIWHEHKLQRCLDAIRPIEGPALVHSDLTVIDENEQVLAPSLFAHQGWDFDAVSLCRLLVQNNATGLSMLLNRALVNLVNKAKPEDVLMHDWWIALTAAAMGEVAVIREPLALYRQHGVNAIGASKKSLFARAFSAFSIRKKMSGRIALTYAQARRFLACYKSDLGRDKDACLRYYIDIENQNRLRQLKNVSRGGYKMQSGLTRLGHKWVLLVSSKK